MYGIEQREHLDHPRPGDLLISAVVLAWSIHHKHIGREVYLVYPCQIDKLKAK